MKQVFFVIFLEFLSKKVIAQNSRCRNYRIHNGFPAEDGQFPFAVLILSQLYNPYHKTVLSCTGSLLQTDIVLTAGHCVVGTNLTAANVVVMAGKADARRYKRFRPKHSPDIKYISHTVQESVAASLLPHPMFQKTAGFDLGLIKLKKPFVETKYVKTINFTTDELPDGVLCYVIGYGYQTYRKNAKRLHFYESKSISANQTLCRPSGGINAFALCSDNDEASVCTGDSGGPLFCNGIIYGVISRAKFYNDFNKVCGAPCAQKFVNINKTETVVKFLTEYAKDDVPSSYTLILISNVSIMLCIMLVLLL